MNCSRYAAVLALTAALAAAPAAAAGPAAAVLNARQVRALRCRCCGKSGLDPRFERLLDRLQHAWPAELRFTSGVRCSAHNARVGGVKNSRHLRGQAADTAMPARFQRVFCALARRLGFRRVLPDSRRQYVHLSL